MSMSMLAEEGETPEKDGNLSRSVEEEDNLPFLDDGQRREQREEEEEDDKSACCEDCDALSVKSNSRPDDQTIHCNEDLFGNAPIAVGNSVSSSVEYVDLPPPEDEEIALEVSAVLVELPADLLPPPPPYTLVRGRRMRFLSQRMHLPADSQQRYLTADLYRLQQPDDQPQQSDPGDGKGCCSAILLPENLNVRWFIIIISFIALCCLVVGIVLGALKGANEFTGDDSLTIALLLIGVGIILMAVSGAAWKLTAKHGSATSLRSMLGFGSLRATSPPLRSFRRASTGPFSAYILRNSFGRGCPGHYYEFQFRPPPPSYHASVSSDYTSHGGVRSLLERNQSTSHNRTPPPIYRARGDLAAANPLPLLSQLNGGSFGERPQRSAPPSYRFRPAAEAGRERASMGQINAMFNENYRTVEGCDPDVGQSHRPRGDGQSAGRTLPLDLCPSPKNSHNPNMELLAQL